MTSLLPDEQIDLQLRGLEDDAWDIPCEEHEMGLRCQHPAEWIIHRLRCCTLVIPVFMHCTMHKDRLLAKPPPWYCRHCSRQFSTLSEVITSVESLNGRLS